MSNLVKESTVLPPSLVRQLTQFRRRLRRLKLVETLFAALAGLLVAYLVVFVIERFVGIPAGLRLAGLITGTTGFSVGLPWVLHKWFWNTRRLEQIARFLRGTFPVLGNEILSVIDMQENRTGQGASPRLIVAATEQTRARVEKQELTDAVSANDARKRGVIVFAVAGLALVLLVVVPAAAGNAWLRFLNPWTSAPRFTFAQIGELPKTVVVPYGESFQVKVPLQEESDWQPETASAVIDAAVVLTPRDENEYLFSLPAQTNETKLNISVGDDRRSVDLMPMTRPDLKKITAKTTLPAYLQYPEPVERSSSSTRFVALRGSRIVFDFEANRDLKFASLDNRPLSTNGRYVSTGPMTVDANRKHVVNWCDIYELQPRKPVELTIKMVEDQAPSIVFEQFEERILLQDKSIRFNFSGRDDFGIRKIGVEWVGQSKSDRPLPTIGEKLLYAGHPQSLSVNDQGIFSPKLENVSPQVLTMRLFVEDYLPNRQRVYSRPQTLHVMSHDEHIAWINENMQRWKSTADAIYEREAALLEENRELRRLTPEERHQPENIRRMESQVAAERDNAQRLDRAVDRGKELIEQALMNENMRADQVVQWAESLERLRNIAREDMPSIADQLNEVADAAKSNPPLTRLEPSESNSSLENRSDEENQRSPVSSLETNAPETAGKNRLENEQQNSTQENSEPSDSSPQLRDVEDSMLQQKENKEASASQRQESGNLDLPTTELRNPDTQNRQNNGQSNEPVEPSLDGVVEDHQKMLEEYRKAQESMDGVMSEFENSTFVKRFKAAARSQLSVASHLNRLMPLAFGAAQPDRESFRQAVAELYSAQTELFEDLRQIKIDLEAYQIREPEESRQKILDEMASLKMQVKLEELPMRIEKNRLGDSFHRVEFWADTFDRWAEELVPPTRPGGGSSSNARKTPGLPPAIVLEVMRQIEDETNLRDETRSFELSRNAMPDNEQRERNDGLTVYQMSIQERSLDTIDDIRRLPDGERDFSGAISKLKKAIEAMNDASGMLFDGMAGKPALAAESAAIEALLESRRLPPPNGNRTPERNDSGQDGSESLANEPFSPMNRLNPDSRGASQIQPRDVGAATASNLDNVPERFRDGIDRFTSKLGQFRKSNSK